MTRLVLFAGGGLIVVSVGRLIQQHDWLYLVGASAAVLFAAVLYSIIGYSARGPVGQCEPRMERRRGRTIGGKTS